jgi:hypothetical protein
MARWGAAAVVILGVVAEAAAIPRLVGLDAVVGFALAGVGFAWRARDGGPGGLLLIAAGSS